MEIKLERLNQPKDLNHLQDIIDSRIEDSDEFNISLEEVDKINLASFNALIKLYVKLRRLNKEVLFIKCQSEKMKMLISKTQLGSVFITE